MTKYIHQYILDRKNQRVGVVLATPVFDSNGKRTVKVGWSKCNTKMGDRFNKEHAIQLAMGRAMMDDPIGNCPPEVGSMANKMYHRGIRYFKTGEHSLINTEKVSTPADCSDDPLSDTILSNVPAFGKLMTNVFKMSASEKRASPNLVS